MKKLKLILLFFVFILGVFLFFEKINLNQIHLMTFSSQSQSGTQSLDQPCQFDFQCQGSLLCRKGWCRPFSQLGESGESCSRPQDCRSNSCVQQKCKATILVSANNGEDCQPNQEQLCRSGQCSENLKCQGSPRFGAFPKEDCKLDTNCLSFRCGSDQRCEFSFNTLTCAPVGERCDNRTQSCCSGSCVDGTCEAKPLSQCTQNNFCAGVVGRICAANGQVVRNDFQCCSGRQSGFVCVADYSKSFVPCRLNSDCRNGFICNQKTSLCSDLNNF